MQQTLRYSGIASLAVTLFTVIWCSYQQNFNLLGKQPISYLGTTSSHSFFEFGILASAVLLGTFYKYISRRFRTSVGYTSLFAAAVVSEIILAIWPETNRGKTQLVHWIAAWVFVASIAFSVLLFALNNKETKVAKVSKATGYTFIFILVPEILLYVVGKSASLSQIINGGIFAVWVIYVSLYTDKRTDVRS